MSASFLRLCGIVFTLTVLAGWLALPAVADAAPKLVSVSSGDSTSCGLTDDGAAFCWGFGEKGTIGNGQKLNAFAPTAVTGIAAGAKSISVQGAVACAVTAGGAVKCWGSGLTPNVSAQPMIDSAVPVELPGMSSGFVDVSVGARHACAVAIDGSVKCWGANKSDSLGSTTDGAPGPVQVDVIGVPAIDVEVGDNFTCVRTHLKGVKCWGSGAKGTLGNGSIANSSAAVDAVGLSSGVRSLHAGPTAVCAILETGLARCWGTLGGFALGPQLGSSPSPIDVQSNGVQFQAISLRTRICGLETTGKVSCWGERFADSFGRLRFASSSNPKQVKSFGAANVAVAVGGRGICATSSSGALRCFGSGGLGELGDNGLVATRAYGVVKKVAVGANIKVFVFCPVGCKLERTLRIGSKRVRLSSKRLPAGTRDGRFPLAAKEKRVARAGIKDKKRVTLSFCAIHPSLKKCPKGRQLTTRLR